MTAPDPAGRRLVPRQARHGVRWMATAAAAIVVATVGVTFQTPQGPRPVPLTLLGVALLVLGLAWDRRRGDGPLGETTVVVGAAVLLLAARAWLLPTADELDVFLGVTGLAFLGLGVARDDRRPVVVGVLQWAVAFGRPTPGGSTWRHCLVATDLQIPLPHLLPVVALGAVALALALLARTRAFRPEASRGLETSGLALVLGGLAAKALELPGHPALCGTGDAIDAGWALAFLAVAATVALGGVRWDDQLWAASGLAAATLFALAAVTLEANPWWGVLVGVPLAVTLWWLERAGIDWPRRGATARGDGDRPSPTGPTSEDSTP